MTGDNHHKKVKQIGELIDLSRFKQLGQKEKVGNETAYDGPNLDTMYYKIFVGFASHFKLKTTETNVLSVIWSLQQKHGWCYASQTTIASATRISVQTLNTILKKLHKHGLLEKGGKNRFGVVRWRLGAEALDRMKYVIGMVDEVSNKNKKTKGGH
jgi:predicted transcriptional regulator